MAVEVSQTPVRSILTRTSGFLRTVASHSLQPYRGCSYGSTLCGVGCYVRHNGLLTRGRPWGSFLEVRVNAAQRYSERVEAERRWAHRQGPFSIFMSSSTDPFVPQERKFRITQSLLEAMADAPPDELIVQTHSHLVTEYSDLLVELGSRCAVRVHLSRRFAAAAALRDAGLRVVITVAPLLPIDEPDAFFARIADHADAVVIDHFIGGDGSTGGARTNRTALPRAMAAIDPASVTIAYRDRMIDLARRHLPGHVGVNIDGFAGRFLSP
jgi:DNA repair photolyase